jgi:hypothetical protein
MTSLARTKCHAPLLLALSPALWLALRAAIEIPLSHDHPTHLFKAWHFWTEMLQSGRLHGWSHFWAFGAPFGELVPSGGEAWVALFRALTLAQLPWDRTYAIAFGAMLVLQAFAAFVFARRYFGAATGVLAAWIALLDPGAMLEGGWVWHTEWGVWPVTLAVSFMLLGLERLEQVLRSCRTRDVALAGGWIAAALLTHQLVLLLLVLAVPLLLLDQRLRSEPAPLAHAAATAGSLAFGVALASAFLVPFLARTGEAQDLGATGESLAEMGRRLVELEVFQHLWRPLQGLGMIGAWLALRARRPGALYIATCAALLVLLSSDLLINALHLERALPTLAKVENNRMLLGAKLFWFPLAAHALVELARSPASSEPARRRWPLRLAQAALAVIALLLIVPGARQLYTTQIQKPIIGERDLPEWQDLQEFIAWSAQLRRDSAEPYRIAYLFHRDQQHNDLLATVLPVYNGTPMYKVGYTPAQIYKRLPTTAEDELFRALGVKYYLTSYKERRASLKLVRRFGRFWLYRFRDYQPDPFTLSGGGQAQLLELSPERVRVQLSGTSPESRLRLHVASYPRWRATIAAAPLPIATVPVMGADYPVLMEVPARDGELVFEYVYRWPDWAGLALSLLAVPVFLTLVHVSRVRAFLARVLAGAQRQQRWLCGATLALLLLVFVVLGLRLRTRAHLLPPTSLFHELEGPELSLGDQPCSKRGPLSFRCGPHALRADAVPSEVWGLHLCMSAPLDAGPLKLHVLTKLGSFVAVSYEATRRGAGIVRVTAGERELGEIQTRPASERQQFLAFDTRALRDQQAPLEITVTGGALRCFDLGITP